MIPSSACQHWSAEQSSQPCSRTPSYTTPRDTICLDIADLRDGCLPSLSRQPSTRHGKPVRTLTLGASPQMGVRRRPRCRPGGRPSPSLVPVARAGLKVAVGWFPISRRSPPLACHLMRANYVYRDYLISFGRSGSSRICRSAKLIDSAPAPRRLCKYSSRSSCRGWPKARR
jgi:hypothetical protein